MRSLFLVFSIVVLSLSASADKMPLLTDGTITTTAEILARIQGDSITKIKTKYNDLQKNFTPNFLTSGIDFDCNSGHLPVGNNAQYAGLRVSNDSKKMADGRIQSFSSITHFGCYGPMIFTERIRVIGSAPVTVTVQDAVKFVRYFEVQPGEISRQYEIENSKSEIVFSVSSQRLNENSDERIFSSVEVGRQKWLELNQLDPSVNERRLFLQMFSGKFQAAKGNYGMNFGPLGSTVLKTFWTDRRIEHYIDSTLTNQVQFDSEVGSMVVGFSSQMLGQIYADFVDSFPATTQVQIGVSDSPFLRELQLNYNRMLTNTDQEQVKLFFQKTIEDIKTGRLKVD